MSTAAVTGIEPDAAARAMASKFEPRPEASTPILSRVCSDIRPRRPSLIRVEQAHLRPRVRIEADLVLAREARVAETLRRRAGGFQHAFEREIAEAVGAQVALDLVHPMARADELLARRRVDPVVARPLDGR